MFQRRMHDKTYLESPLQAGNDKHSAVGLMRRLALVCRTPRFDGNEMPLPMPSYGIHRVHAAAQAASQSPEAETRLFDLGEMGDVAGLEAILAYEPDLVGFSAYVWSLLPLVEIAKQLRCIRPQTLLLWGGPSSRRELFDHIYYRHATSVVDAICEGDGEAPIDYLMKAPVLNRQTLAACPGIWTKVDPSSDWKSSIGLNNINLSDLPSPYQQGLMPADAVGYLETYRGCPLACKFCAWGVARPARDVFSVDYITRELEAFRKLRAPAVFLLDAGLNLNARGFENLVAAQERSGFLSQTLLWAEIYPTIAKHNHLEFLASVGTAYLGVGLQSVDNAVLKAHDRPFDMRRFTTSIEKLARVAGLELQIIMGLPEDTPDGFRKTLDFALSLPVQSVRVYHCLVLPDALLSRSNPSWQVDFDPANMSMRSNHSWSAWDLQSMRQELNDRVAGYGGAQGEYWWSFRK